MMAQNSYYGNYRTRTFSEIFPEADDFIDFYADCGIPHKIDNSINTVYYLLLSRYANSPIASSDENRFKFNTMSIIFQFGPTWEKRLAIQDELRTANFSDLLQGNVMINNHAFNPETEPGTTTAEELTYINEQSVTKQKKGKLNAYAELMSLLDTDVTGEFLDRFKRLFAVWGPELPLYYTTNLEENYNDNEYEYENGEE